MAKKNTAPKGMQPEALPMGQAFLIALATATLAKTHLMTTADQRASVDASLLMTNPAIVGPNGELATIASPAGMAAAGVSDKPKLTVLSNLVLPEPKRGNFGGGNKRESAYDFDSLEVNQGWFIVASDAQPNPAKSLASTVSGASKRWSKELATTHERRQKVVNEAGEDVLDANGKPTFAVVQIPDREYERKFEIRKIEDATPYGFPAVNGVPVTGALIARVK